MTTDPSPSSSHIPAQLLLAAGLGIIASLLIAAASWFFFLRSDAAYAFHGGFYEPPKPAPSLQGAVDQHGEPFRLEDHRGKLVFVYFGYTQCPDACPATLDQFMNVKELLGEDAQDVEFVMITVDPLRDSPERLAEYMEFWDPEFHGVSMPEAETGAVTRAWNIRYTHGGEQAGGDHQVDHEVSSFVIDKDGNIRLTYSLGFEPALIAEDARHLLGE